VLTYWKLQKSEKSTVPGSPNNSYPYVTVLVSFSNPGILFLITLFTCLWEEDLNTSLWKITSKISPNIWIQLLRDHYEGGVIDFFCSHFLGGWRKPQTCICFWKAETELFLASSTFPMLSRLWNDLQSTTGQNPYFFSVRVPMNFEWCKMRQNVWRPVAPTSGE